MPDRPVLRVISSDPAEPEREVEIDLAKEALREAEWYRNLYRDTPTPYGKFIVKHGRLPTKEEASDIGRGMGCRVRADNGRHYPLPTKDERRAQREAKKLARQRSALYGDMRGVVDAVEHLARMPASRSLEEVMGKIKEYARHNDTIAASLGAAVEYLIRFAEEYRRHEPSPRRASRQITEV